MKRSDVVKAWMKSHRNLLIFIGSAIVINLMVVSQPLFNLYLKCAKASVCIPSVTPILAASLSMIMFVIVMAVLFVVAWKKCLNLLGISALRAVAAIFIWQMIKNDMYPTPVQFMVYGAIAAHVLNWIAAKLWDAWMAIPVRAKETKVRWKREKLDGEDKVENLEIDRMKALYNKDLPRREKEKRFLAKGWVFPTNEQAAELKWC